MSSAADTLGAGPRGACTLRDALVVADATSNPALRTRAEPGGRRALRDCAGRVRGHGVPFRIALSPGVTYTLSKVDNYWFGPDALPPISASVTIVGNDATVTRASAPGTRAFRFFYVAGGRSGMPAGNLTLQDLTLSDGLAKGGNGGNSGGAGAGMGGAIFDQGTLALRRVTLSGNRAQGGYSSGSGGGNGGGIGAGWRGGFGGRAPGARHVSAGFAGAGLGDGVVGVGGGAAAPPSIGGNGYDGGFGAGGGSAMSETGGFSGGDGGFGGGGAGAGPAGNGPGSGGFGGGDGGDGGEDYVDGGGGAGMGGAVFSLFGRVTVADSTLFGNRAVGGPGDGAVPADGTAGDGLGGAVFNLDGSLTMSGATIAGNAASGGSEPAGGGLFSLAFGNTLTSRAATRALVSVAGSIIFANTGLGGGDDDLSLEGVNGRHTNTSVSALLSPSIIGVTSAARGTVASGSPITSNPQLGVLESDGQSPATMEPAADSPALGAGMGCDATDERGTRRPANHCDLGAFEQTPAG